jgi:uncharacterized repeat protein (TIGR01451 family)
VGEDFGAYAPTSVGRHPSFLRPHASSFRAGAGGSRTARVRLFFALTLLLTLRSAGSLRTLPAVQAVTLQMEEREATGQRTEEDLRRQIAAVQVPFLENRGQMHPDIRFAADMAGGKALVTTDGITYVIGGEGERMVLRDSFAGGSVAPHGKLRAETIVHIHGGDVQGGLPTYDTVTLGDVWEGVRIDLRARGNAIEKVFRVRPDGPWGAPGGNVGEIVVVVDGIEGMEIGDAGQLILTTEFGTIGRSAPLAYQEVGGERQTISVRYRVLGENKYGFMVGTYDASHELVIDPLLAGTYVGGTRSEGWAGTTAVGIDASGNIFLATRSDSANYPTVPNPGAYRTTNADGSFDVAVSKFNSDMSSLLASTYVGGRQSGSIRHLALAVSPGGKVYVASRFNWSPASSIATTPGAYDTTCSGGDAYIIRFSNSLAAEKATCFGDGTPANYGFSIFDLLVAPDGKLYATGLTQGTGLPWSGWSTGQSYDPSHNGGTDLYVMRMDADLSAVDAGTYFGGGSMGTGEFGYGLARDAQGNVFVAGQSLTNADVPNSTPMPAPGHDRTFNPSSGYQGWNMFVVKFNAGLTSLLGNTFLGQASRVNNNSEYGFTRLIATDASGNVYVTGATASSSYPTTPGAYDRTVTYQARSVLSKLSLDLTTLYASTYVPGVTLEAPALALDPGGNVVVAGMTSAACDRPTSPGAYRNTLNQPSGTYYADASILKLDSGLSAGGRQYACSGVDLAPAMTHAGDFSAGSTGTYTLIAHNDGSASTVGTVTMTIQLPTAQPYRLTFNAISGSGWTCPVPSGQTITCTRSASILAHAASPALTLTVNVPQGTTTTVVPSATLSGGGEPATRLANNGVTDPTTILGPLGSVTFTLYVRNDGPHPARGMVVTFPVPAGLTLSGATYAGSPVSYCITRGSQVVCQFPAESTRPVNTFAYYAPGNALALTFSYNACPPGNEFTAVATVPSDLKDPNGGNNVSNAVTKAASACQ